MSLPDGQVRDLLFNVAIESSDSSMRDLFYLDRQDRMMDVGFIDIYTKGIRVCSGSQRRCRGETGRFVLGSWEVRRFRVFPIWPIWRR